MKREIVPLSHDVLANLSVEELESRLEMQILTVLAADGSCTGHVGCEGNTCCNGEGSTYICSTLKLNV